MRRSFILCPFMLLLVCFAILLFWISLGVPFSILYFSIDQHTVVVVVLVEYPPSSYIATLNSPDHSSVTTSFLPISLLISQYTFNFAKNCLLLMYMPRQWYTANNLQVDKNFMISQTESVLYHSGIELASLDSQCNALMIELTGGY